MKCLECGHETTSKIADHKYDECGVSNIILKEIEIIECTNCSEREIVIPDIYDLHNAIATTISSTTSKLNGEEIRFLRSHLGFSSSDFAKAIGVNPSVVSRWENDRDQIGKQSEKLLRLMVLTNSKPFTDYKKMEKYGSENKQDSKTKANYRNIGGKWNAA